MLTDISQADRHTDKRTDEQMTQRLQKGLVTTIRLKSGASFLLSKCICLKCIYLKTDNENVRKQC